MQFVRIRQSLTKLINFVYFRSTSLSFLIAMASTVCASIIAAPVAARNQVAFKPASKSLKAVTVSNGNIAKTTAFKVWQPTNNKVSRC
jgi:hypothetical protein